MESSELQSLSGLGISKCFPRLWQWSVCSSFLQLTFLECLPTRCQGCAGEQSRPGCSFYLQGVHTPLILPSMFCSEKFQTDGKVRRMIPICLPALQWISTVNIFLCLPIYRQAYINFSELSEKLQTWHVTPKYYYMYLLWTNLPWSTDTFTKKRQSKRLI